MQAETLTGGFADAPHDAAHAFRAIMEAMARPGTIHRIAGAQPPAPLSVAAGAVLLTLCDPETALHLAGSADTGAVRDWVTFHCGAPLAGRGQAAFALGAWPALLPLGDYAIGTPEYPDRSATLIVEVPVLEASGARLTGPGIATEAALSLPETAAFQANARAFPLGLDFIFTCGDRLAALPRSTRIG
ncbi:MAG: phosphonate C-P lyase system protein PhnH [Limimaricola sp.]|uniref:phosphonate C-P lyase system protein PhnH n=1 Tax=Limimaricola sp. TaxID=2211665 RepID=UPI001DEE2080|nr:phosphonate C-P lyase system protein PhnH [Limimaricola sp.]MBI1416450.1 phosphonate C-P lyase system protein PhnH [Limimaricola sp.]